jgi:hypothetical protein
MFVVVVRPPPRPFLSRCHDQDPVAPHIILAHGNHVAQVAPLLEK